MQREFILHLLLCFFLLTPPLSMANEEGPKLWQLSPEDFFAQRAVKAEINLQEPNEYLLAIAIFQATNQVREKKRLPKLLPNKSLYLAGATHIAEMRKHQFFGHVNAYNVEQRSVMQRIRNQQGQFNIVAENLALLPSFISPNQRYRYRKTGNTYLFYQLNGKEMKPHTYESFAKEVVTEWYRSHGHRENLLSPELAYIGVAVYIEPFDYRSHKIPKIYAVQEFGAYLK